MTVREPLLIGPFGKGLNTFDDPSSIDDTECVEALNFDPGLDGALRSRPPFTDTEDPLTLGATAHPRLLGYYYDTAGAAYLLASDGLSSTYQYSSGTWTLITNTFSAVDMTQYDGKAWLVAPVGEPDPGGYWEPVGGFVADPDMPAGTSIISYKSRLWIAEGMGGSNPTRMRYSKVLGQSSFWDSPGFVDVAAGDGEAIVKLVNYFDTILVFRSRSIWVFQYGTDPATAIQSVIVPGIGLTNRHSLVAHENYLYFMYDEKAYEFVNNKAQQLNVKVPFSTLSPGLAAHPFSVSVFNNRILYSYYENIYVFSLRTRTWTKWRSDVWGPIGQVMSSLVEGASDTALALTSGTVPLDDSPRQASLLAIQEDVGSGAEQMQCVLQTKNYSFNLPGSFKVLFWWGIDSIFRTQARGQAIPVVYNLGTSWGQLLAEGATWGALLAGTWAHPFLSDPSITTDVELDNAGPSRKFVRFLKKLRFRQLYFRVVFDIDGSFATAPVQLFTISAYLGEKQTVSKQIS